MKVPTPPTIVDLAGLARYILSNDCQSIAILTGAGVSVSSGIPDFRSPGGMYDTLRPELITATKHQRELMKIDPTYVVSWDIFRENSFPYLEVRRPFILGTQEQKWKATIAHRFFELLEVKLPNKLRRIYTQNIDGLDFQCNKIPKEKIISVHGTIGQAKCEHCDTEMDYNTFCDRVRTNIKDIYDPNNIDNKKESTEIPCENCSKPLVKPNTVLFGRSLPADFFICTENDLPTLDLLIVAGTSLVVSPANSVVYRVPKSTTRVIVNQNRVGEDLGIEYDSKNKSSKGRDFFAQGNCDEIFLDLIQELGWLDDLKHKINVLPPKSAALIQSRCK